MLKTQDFVGKKVVLALINSNRDEGYQAKLLGVESGGVWVDCDELLGPHRNRRRKFPSLSLLADSFLDAVAATLANAFLMRVSSSILLRSYCSLTLRVALFSAFSKSDCVNGCSLGSATSIPGTLRAFFSFAACLRISTSSGWLSVSVIL